jgi:hypothetical protein
MLRVGGLGTFGLSLPTLLGQRAAASSAKTAATGRKGKAKACIVLFLMGGPPQQSTWDPKPDAIAQVRGEVKPIATSVTGVTFGELMPKTAQLAHKIAVLRAMSTNDNAHSSSGYYMMTGYPHLPMNVENANPGAPNNWPFMGAVVQHLRKSNGTLPGSVRLPNRIFNTDGSIWPGQDSGFLGRNAEPWLFTCQPASPSFRVPELSLAAETPAPRLDGRHSLLQQLGRGFDAIERGGALSRFDRQTQQAFELLSSSKSREAFRLDLEPAAMRDRYGPSQFGQSVLLARRLVEAGVSLIQVNWFRGADEPADNPCWDSHTNEAPRLKTVLMPPFDRAYSALLEDLASRGMLDETLVVVCAEFGRTPKINARAGRDHWGHVFSVALAGGGIRGGIVHGASDKIGGHPRDGRVSPQDLSATIFHCLGFQPNTEIHDTLGRPVPITRGEVIRQIVY